jgi:hypothetical protein
MAQGARKAGSSVKTEGSRFKVYSLRSLRARAPLRDLGEILRLFNKSRYRDGV